MCGCLVTHPGTVFAGGINTRLSKDMGPKGIKHLICSFVQFFPLFPILGNLLFSLPPTCLETPFVGDTWISKRSSDPLHFFSMVNCYL